MPVFVPAPIARWLDQFAIPVGTCLAGFELTQAAWIGSEIELTFADGRHSMPVRVVEKGSGGRAFGETPSFLVSHRPAPEVEGRRAAAVVKALLDRLRLRDKGGERLPVAPAPMPSAASPREERPRSGLFRVADVDASDLSAHPDALYEIFQRRLEVMLVRNVFSRVEVEGIVAELERPGADFEWFDNIQSEKPIPRQPYNLGLVLIPTARDPSGPRLQSYFEEAARFRARCKKLFSGGRDFEERIIEVLSAFSGKRQVEIPRGPNGESYTPATVRAIPPGGELALHVGNYFKDFAGYAHLQSFVDVNDQLSYFVVLANGDEGGDIDVFDLEWADPRRPLTPEGRIDIPAVIERFPMQGYRPAPGDMFLFDGGRFYHRVSPVVGSNTRWTIGGFITLSLGHDRYYFWS